MNRDATSPQNGEQIPRLIRSPPSKIDTIKNWSISTYKCTKQLMFERLGKTSRTIDTGTTGKLNKLFWFLNNSPYFIEHC